MSERKAKRKDVESEEPALVEVRFLKRDAPWNAGDTALFPRIVASKLIAAEVAEEVAEDAEG